MFFQKNGVSFNGIFGKATAFGAALFCLTGLAGSASAAYDPCCPDPCYQDPCCFDPCACEMPDFVVYADFLYWQVNVGGLEYAAATRISDNNGFQNQEFDIFAPDCEMEPGFRLGLVVDLGCCNWDFYAQYTWLNQCIEDHRFVPFNGSPINEANEFIFPLIFSPFIEDFDAVNLARGKWDSNFNVLDFGFGRTFSVNCCFDFRPHLGFKATWQDLCYDVRYEQDVNSVQAGRIDIHNEIDFNGIGLRGGFDAAWRFSSCFSLVGGFAFSSVWSQIDIHRVDTFTTVTEGSPDVVVAGFEVKNERCVLIPVSELLLGLRYDTTICDCYDIFVFVGWENQVWWDLNNYVYLNVDSIQHGTHGNVTYQGLTLRTGLDF